MRSLFNDGESTIDITSMEGKTIKIEGGKIIIDPSDELTGAENVVGNPSYDFNVLGERGWKYKIDNVKTLNRGSLTIINARNVVVNEVFFIEHADSVINNGSIAINVDNYTGVIGEFYVDKADMVMNDNIMFTNVTHSGFTVYSNALKATPDFNVTLSFTDPNDVIGKFTALTDHSSIKIINGLTGVEGSEGSVVYMIKEGRLTIDQMEEKGYSETISCLNQCSVFL